MLKRVMKNARWQNMRSLPDLGLVFHKSYRRSVHHLLCEKPSVTETLQEESKPKKKTISQPKVNETPQDNPLTNKIWNKDSIMAAVESVLFCSSDAVTIDQISEILLIPTSVIWNAIDELEERYDADYHGVMIIKKDDYISIVPKESLHPYLIKVAMLHKRPRFSLAHKEVLALVAYKQPITRKEIEDLRGARSDHAIEKMLSYGLIQRSDETPARYTTTDLFAEVFGTRPEDLIPKKTDAIEVPLVI